MKNKEQLIKSNKRKRSFGEVYTPSWLVKNMCDMLPEDAWNDIHKTFLEPSCGNGNFLVEILDRKLKLCKNASDGLVALSSIYGIDIQEDNVQESIQRMYSMFVERFGESNEALEILQQNIICADSLKLLAIIEKVQTNDVAEGWEIAKKKYAELIKQEIEEKQEKQISLF